MEARHKASLEQYARLGFNPVGSVGERERFICHHRSLKLYVSSIDMFVSKSPQSLVNIGSGNYFILFFTTSLLLRITNFTVKVRLEMVYVI